MEGSARKAVEAMNCEEFELRGLDLDRLDADPMEAAAAAEHAEDCARCGALLNSWREVRNDLRLLREATRLDAAPARVEMRLKQELRTRREARVPRSMVAVAAWAMAVAAVLVASFGWVRTHHKVAAPGLVASNSLQTTSLQGISLTPQDDQVLLAADNDSGEFTQLPGSLPEQSGDQAILQVRLQRGALGRFGFPVDAERAAEWVNVDFLVDEDGQPQAVRLHQDAQTAAVVQ